MYVIKVLHGYIGKDGRRTREKIPDKLWVFEHLQIKLVVASNR